jgi:glycosyltransferase involved in cell wall biosynthesis
MHPPASRRYFEHAFERSLRRADALITDSEAVRQELIADFAVAPERVTAIHLGVDPTFRPRAAEELRPALARHSLQPGGYLLSVATLEPRKKLDRLVAAYAELPETLRRQYPLVLTGAPGWLEGPIRTAIERGHAAGWLRFLGYVPEDELPLVYAGARALAMISVYEGFGLPVLEAMASGLPVVAYDCAAAAQLIRCGKNGVLAPFADLPAFVRHALALACDGALRRAIGEQARRSACELDWDGIAARFEGVLAAVIRQVAAPAEAPRTTALHHLA